MRPSADAICTISSIDPRYQLVVVNRLSPENRVEDITPELQIQDQDPYMFYKNRRGETHGIWFYNGQDRERIVAFLEGCVSLRCALCVPLEATRHPSCFASAKLFAS